MEKYKIPSSEIEVYIYDNPMTHSDWHEVEQNELVQAVYLHHGPDYWDDELVFCKPDDKDIVFDYFKPY